MNEEAPACAGAGLSAPVVEQDEGGETAPPHLAAQVLVDRDGVVRLWSEGCERLFGYNAGEVVGGSVEFMIVPSLRASHRLGLAAAMAQADIGRREAAGNIPVLHADGEVRAHPFRQFQLYDAFGRSTGAIVIFSDPISPGTMNGLPHVFADALPS